MVRFIGLVMIAVLAVNLSPALLPSTVQVAARADAVHHEQDEAATEHKQRGLLELDPGSAVWSIVLFVILLVVLSKFAWPHILKGLQDREQKIRSDLEQAAKAARDATATMAEYEAKLADARQDARALIEEAKVGAERFATQLKATAQADVEQIRKRAEHEITAAKEQALVELYTETAALATQVAGRIIQRELRPEDQEQLINEAVRQFRETQNN